VPNRLDGVEVKGSGRQVVAWDSLHKSGGVYEKLGGSFAELPEPFVSRVRASTAQHSLSGTVDATPEAQELLARWLDLFPEAEELRDGNWQMTCPAHADHDPASSSPPARTACSCTAGRAARRTTSPTPSRGSSASSPARRRCSTPSA
jgi:hypothetical protein